MKNIIFVIICFALVSNSFSQTGDANFNKIVKEYTLNNDGSIDYHETKSIELLSHFAFHRLHGETFIIYNTDYQELKVNSSYTIMADGKKITTPSNAYNEVLPRFSNNAPYYNNIREMVVTHTGLEVGSVINLDYTIHTEAGFYPALFGDELLNQSSPVNELIIRVTIPENKELNYKLLNETGEPVVSSEKSNKVYTWSFKSLKATSKEYYQISDNSLLPRLVFSTLNPDQAYNEFVSQSAFDYMTNETMSKVVSDIMNKETDKLKVALELQKVVSNNLGNINIPLEYTGFKCRNTIETWNSNQGTPLEKSILLSALLKKANIEAIPVAIIPTEILTKDVGNLLSFNQFMVRVKIKKQGGIYLHPNKTDGHNQKYDMGGKAILALDKELSKVKYEIPKPSTKGIAIKARLELQNTDKLLGEINLTLNKGANPYLSIYQDSSKVKSMVTGISGIKESQIKKLTQDECISVISFKMDKPTTIQGKYHTLTLPKASGGVDSWHINLLTADRDAPLEIPSLIEERYEYAIVLPAEAKMVSNPTFSIISNEAGSVTIQYEQKENEIIILKEIKLTKKIISPSYYSKFKDIMDVWNNKMFGEVVFK
mgnify:CR=1 FL=1